MKKMMYICINKLYLYYVIFDKGSYKNLIFLKRIKILKIFWKCVFVFI